MAMLMIEIADFRMMLKMKASFSDYEQYCNSVMYVSEWKQLMISEQRELFEEFVDTATIEDLIEKRLWRIVFEKKPKICGSELSL